MKIIVVTGASSGMGRVFAHELAKKHKPDEMWLIARRENRLRELAEEISGESGVKSRVMPPDLTDSHSLEIYREALGEAGAEISVLVNAGGFGKFGYHTAVDTSVSLNMIDLNCKALLAMTDASLPHMTRGSQIYQLGSLSAFQPVPYLNTYAATKAFVLSYSRGLAAELRPKGFRVMAVCPGWVKTEFFGRAETSDKDAITYFNRMYTPEEIVKTAIRDMERGRGVSIHGLPIKLQVLAVKLLPVGLVMKIWLPQQGHNK